MQLLKKQDKVNPWKKRISNIGALCTKIFFLGGFHRVQMVMKPTKRKQTHMKGSLKFQMVLSNWLSLRLAISALKEKGKYFHSFSKTGWGCKLESKFWAGLQNQYCWLKFSPFVQAESYDAWVTRSKLWMKLVDAMRIGFKFVKGNYGWS
jgi:hypothetical protein